MLAAIFGLVGVLIGSTLTWIKDYLSEKRKMAKEANYLAIRVACILNKYAEDCANVVYDDGFCEGQRNSDGCLEPQVALPPHPKYPEDVDWKSIESQLMYKLLSFPDEAYRADRTISASSDHSDPPDYEDFFTERHYQYSCLGLRSLHLERLLKLAHRIEINHTRDSNLEAKLKSVKKEIEKNRRDLINVES